MCTTINFKGWSNGKLSRARSCRQGTFRWAVRANRVHSNPRRSAAARRRPRVGTAEMAVWLPNLYLQCHLQPRCKPSISIDITDTHDSRALFKSLPPVYRRNFEFHAATPPIAAQASSPSAAKKDAARRMIIIRPSGWSESECHLRPA